MHLDATKEELRVKQLAKALEQARAENAAERLAHNGCNLRR